MLCHQDKRHKSKKSKGKRSDSDSSSSDDSSASDSDDRKHQGRIFAPDIIAGFWYRFGSREEGLFVFGLFPASA